MAKNNIAFALDYSCANDALKSIEQLHPYIGYAKIGLELFIKEGYSIIEEVSKFGIDIFLDLKLHDIPETVERAVAIACSFGIKLLTIHTSGGPTMINRAVNRCNLEATGTQLLGVTVLTSINSKDLTLSGNYNSIENQVLSLARMAHNAGLSGFVSSPLEVLKLRQQFGKGVLLVTPGIRSLDVSDNDQKRISTPKTAIDNGADILVIGRQIRDSIDPVEAVKKILSEIE